MALSIPDAGPAIAAAAITPDDNNDLTNYTRAILVGGAGNLACITRGGDTVTFSGLLAGVVYPFALKRIKSTGTTATNLVALY